MPVLSTVGAASLGAFGAFKGFGAAGGFIVATGGTIYVDPTDANYKIHEFTTSGTFTVTTAPTGATLALLLVAGGGSGDGGGGGAGGYIYRSSFSISEGSYAVDIGVGGDPTGSAPTSGGNSEFAGLAAIGGGSRAAGFAQGNGGSGAGSYSTYGGIGWQPTSSSGGYGNNGARAGYPFGLGYGGGGGGGAGGEPSTYIGGAGRTADIINSSGAYETMASGGWGSGDSYTGAVALPAVGYGTGGWGGRTNDSEGNYVESGYGGGGILRVRYKFQ